MAPDVTTASATVSAGSGADFDALNASVREHFGEISKNRPLFTTDAENLYLAYLGALPPSERQHHTCHACHHFINRFGNLAVIQEDGTIAPALWNPDKSPAYYPSAIAAMADIVRKAKVTGVFLCSAPVWGQPVTGPWTHFAVTPDPMRVFPAGGVKTAGQMMAEKREDFRMLAEALQGFPAAAVDQAVTILEADALSRSEKFLGVARWLQDLHNKRASAKNARFAWLAVATAPPGFCHVRSTMIGTLLEDIVAGMPFEDIRRRFAEKLHPLQYQRPQSAPDAANIAQAEKLVEQLGIAASLRRRFARLEEVEAFWRPPTPPASEAASSGSVFGHLKPKDAAGIQPVELPTQTMTWVRFRDTVLPNTAKIELRVPHISNFTALLTAADPDAPPILQWDSLEKRNPVSWYVYHGGSPASAWGLAAGSLCSVTAICYPPPLWNGGVGEHHGNSLTFLLEGARDSRTGQGNALFPELMRSELHGVRKTIEAYSRTAVIEGREEASACGYRAQKGLKWSDCILRVTSKTGSVATYQLDRWE